MRSLKRAAALLLSVAMVATTAFSATAANNQVKSVSETVISTDTVDVKTDVKVKDLVYNGKYQGPVDVTITMGNKTLRNGRDFRLVYQEHKNVGVYHLWIVGIGKYSGVLKDAYYKITKKPVNIKVSGVASSYKASDLKNTTKSVKLNITGTTRKNQLKYYVPVASRKAISVSKGVVTLKKNVKPGTYKFLIYAPALKNFGRISKVVTIRVR